MRAFRTAMLGLCLALAGCAAAMPGYVPPSKTRDRMLAHTQTGGGFDPDGTYRLTDQEQKLDCKSLTGSISVKILQMREAGSRARPSAISSKTQSVIRPIKGGTTYGEDLDRDLAQDRARLESLNTQLGAKGCRTFDIEKELAPGNTAPPTPVGEAKGKAKG